MLSHGNNGSSFHLSRTVQGWLIVHRSWKSCGGQVEPCRTTFFWTTIRLQLPFAILCSQTRTISPTLHHIKSLFRIWRRRVNRRGDFESTMGCALWLQCYDYLLNDFDGWRTGMIGMKKQDKIEEKRERERRKIRNDVARTGKSLAIATLRWKIDTHFFKRIFFFF